jgi:hypothetical protein
MTHVICRASFCLFWEDGICGSEEIEYEPEAGCLTFQDVGDLNIDEEDDDDEFDWEDDSDEDLFDDDEEDDEWDEEDDWEKDDF